MATTSLRDSALSRRLVTVPAVLVAAVVLIPLAVLILPISALADLVRGRGHIPTARVLAFGYSYLVWEVIAVLTAAVLWLASGFGLALRTRFFQEAHRRVQVVWAASHMATLKTTCGLELDVTGIENLLPGPVILLSRHASIIDTLIPIQLTAEVSLGCRYVLKNELLWDPALDIIGHRFPNYFVDRSGGNSASAVDRVADLASGTRATEAFVIFPEGSRFAPAKRERAIEKLRENNPVLAERAEKLTHTMPPRTGGPVAALRARPTGADVVVLAHTGLEGLAGPRELLRAVPFREPVRIDLRRFAGSDIPDDDEGRLNWLYDRWNEVNTWVSDHQAPATS